jgi:hypothetical protein
MGLAVAGLALTALSTGLGAVGMIGQQNAQAQAASATPHGPAISAGRRTEPGADAPAGGRCAAARAGREEDRRRLTAQQIGQQRAGLAAQGTDLEGSPTDIIGDTAAAGEVEALTIRSKAARQAYEHQIAGVGYGNAGILESNRARNATYQPNHLGAGASLLSGASTLAEKWRNFQLKGAA